MPAFDSPPARGSMWSGTSTARRQRPTTRISRRILKPRAWSGAPSTTSRRTAKNPDRGSSTLRALASSSRRREARRAGREAAAPTVEPGNAAAVLDVAARDRDVRVVLDGLDQLRQKLRWVLEVTVHHRDRACVGRELDPTLDGAREPILAFLRLAVAEAHGRSRVRCGPSHPLRRVVVRVVDNEHLVVEVERPHRLADAADELLDRLALVTGGDDDGELHAYLPEFVGSRCASCPRRTGPPRGNARARPSRTGRCTSSFA